MTPSVSFEAFVVMHSATLQRSAWLLTRDWGEADELVQQALLVLWQRWERVSPEDPARIAYARQVLFRKFLRDRRSNRVTVALDWTVDTAIPGHEDRTVLRYLLAGRIAELPPKQRAVIVLRYFADLSERETARTLGCSISSVKANTSRGLAKLRVLMNDDRKRSVTDV